MIKCAVCDDEPLMARELSERVSAYLRKKGDSPFCIECFSGGGQLLESGCDFDLIFLDIQMQAPDGMETARLLRRQGNRSLLIFVTVLQECVFGAFEVEAFDYLLKPLDNARFARTMDRALHVLAQDASKSASRSVLIRQGASCTVVPLEQLLFCEVQGRELYLHQADKSVLHCRERLEMFAQRLDNRFFRCHRSYLVNLDHVRSIQAGQAALFSGGGIPVSRLRERDLKQALLQRMREREG